MTVSLSNLTDMVVDEGEGEFGENERIWFIEGRGGKIPRWHN